MPKSPSIITREAAETIPQTALATSTSLEQKTAPSPNGKHKSKEVTARISNCSDLEPEEVKWFKKNVFPLDRLSILSGEIGTQKTFFLCAAAVACMNGVWPDGEVCEQGDVLYLSDDDEIADNILPKILAAGGSREQLHYLNLSCEEETIEIDLEAHKVVIKKELQAHPNIRLIILDPADAFYPGIDGWNNTKTRKALRPLRQMGPELGITVIMAGHFNKGEKSSAADKAMGSKAWVSVPRATWQVHFDPDDDNEDQTTRRRLMVPIRVSSATEQPPTICFTVTKPEPGHSCGKIEFVPYKKHVTADTLSGKQSTPTTDKWLRIQDIFDSCFAKHGNFCPVKEITKALQDSRITYSNNNVLSSWRNKYGATSERKEGYGPCWILTEANTTTTIHSNGVFSTATTVSKNTTTIYTNGGKETPSGVRSSSSSKDRIANLASRFNQETNKPTIQ